MPASHEFVNLEDALHYSLQNRTEGLLHHQQRPPHSGQGRVDHFHSLPTLVVAGAGSMHGLGWHQLGRRSAADCQSESPRSGERVATAGGYADHRGYLDKVPHDW